MIIYLPIYTMSSKFYFTKEDLRNPNLELPSNSKLASIFNTRRFKLEILPFKEGKNRKFLATCNLCNYNKISTWPFNTTNSNSHFENKHFTYLESCIHNTSSNLDEPSTINTISNYFSNPSNDRLVRKRPSFVLFNKEEYKNYPSNFVISNNLPFSIVDSNSFRNLLRYIKDDLPTISRHTIRNELDNLYILETRKLEDKNNNNNNNNNSNNNNSKSAITLNEWRSSSNLDFLAITLHFYDSLFNLESYLIGFEDLNHLDNYSTSNIYPIIESTLEEYNIGSKLLGVTRDNASSINSSIDLLYNNLQFKYSIDLADIKCFAHILNLVSNSVLDFIFFNTNNTKKFNNKIQNMIDSYEFRNSNTYINRLLEKNRALPITIRTYITKFKNNHFLKNNFKKVVQEYKEDTSKIENLDKDNITRWLSTCNMIKRF